MVFFVDLQKTFDTVDHDILLDKLEHCGVREIANKWFETYLKDMQHFFSNKLLQFGMCTNWCPTKVCSGSFTIPFAH